MLSIPPRIAREPDRVEEPEHPALKHSNWSFWEIAPIALYLLLAFAVVPDFAFTG
jgi:hypothetical protein